MNNNPAQPTQDLDDQRHRIHADAAEQSHQPRSTTRSHPHRAWTTCAATGLALLLPLAGCRLGRDTATDEAMPDIAALSTSAEVECDFDDVKDLQHTPTCFEISVPEDWSNPDDDDQVVLHAAVFRSSNPDANDAAPLMYLDGGPGAPTLDSLTGYEPAVDAFVGARDLVFFDQRGAGTSTPSLDCDAESDQLLAAYAPDVDDDVAASTYLAAMTACHDRLQAAGVNLSAYNSVASSHDIEAIRTALDYQQLDVWGISYGTRLAQSYMRLYPDSARSVVIDSVLPVDAAINEDLPAHAKQSIERLFAACKADRACSGAYPEFESDFDALYEQLTIEPETIDVNVGDETVTVVFNGDDLMHLAFLQMYDSARFENLPRAITAARQGDFAEIALFYSWAVNSDLNMSEGMHMSVMCHDQVAFESREERDANAAADPRFEHAGSVEDDTFFDVCAMWDAGRAPAVEREPVTSDTPTLVVTGFFDPITPPQYAEHVATTLGASHLVEFPTQGHGPSFTGCGFEIVSAFLADPTVAPDSSCVHSGSGPTWVAEPSDLELVPGEVVGIGADSATTITGLLPAGWEVFTPGVLLRSDSMTDSTILLVDSPGDRTVEETMDESLEGLPAEAFEIDEPTDVAGTRWETRSGELDGTAMRLLVSPNNEFVVMIAAAPDEIDELTQTVAIPVAASLRLGVSD